MTTHFSPAFLVYVTGMTNAGKSTLLNAAPAEWGRVEIGKWMRAKYPPSHFAGQSNPKHTAVEAWQMYLDAVARFEEAGIAIILIDGQPRDTEQCEAVLADKYHRGHRLFLHLWAPPEILAARAKARDGDDAEKLALSHARLTNDVAPNYHLQCRIASAGEPVLTRNTCATNWQIRSVIKDIQMAATGWRANTMKGDEP
jgi:hypothetical protein